MIFGWQHLESTVLGLRRSECAIGRRDLTQQLKRRTCMTETEKRPCKPDLGPSYLHAKLAMCLNSSTKFGSSMKEQFSDPSFLKGAFTFLPRWKVHHARKGPSEGKTSESAVNLANRSTKLWISAKISICRWCGVSPEALVYLDYCNKW